VPFALAVVRSRWVSEWSPTAEVLNRFYIHVKFTAHSFLIFPFVETFINKSKEPFYILSCVRVIAGLGKRVAKAAPLHALK
jgi:hypothetical protein